MELNIDIFRMFFIYKSSNSLTDDECLEFAIKTYDMVQIKPFYDLKIKWNNLKQYWFNLKTINNDGTIENLTITIDGGNFNCNQKEQLLKIIAKLN